MVKSILSSKYVQGKEQIVNVCNKTKFSNLVAALCPRSEPKFTAIECGNEHVKVSVQIELLVEGESKNVVVECEAFITASEAEENAIIHALKTLEENGVLRVLDFSTKIASFFYAQNTYGYVNEAMGHFAKILDNFEKTLASCKELALQLEGNEVFETLNGNITGKVDVYSALNQLLCAIVRKFSRKTSSVRSKIHEIDFELQMHHKKEKEKAKATMMKGKCRNVCLASKHILEYVLSYLGFQKARYTNGPDRRGGVKAEVKFRVPYIKRVKYCGDIEIAGKGKNSAYSEEDAAYQALLFIQDNYNVSIVDFNHADRVEAENNQKILLKMLRDVINVTSDVKDMWEKLVESIETQREQYSLDGSSVFQMPLIEEKIDAYNFCACGIEQLGEVSANYYHECLPLFERMEKLTWELSALNIKLDID